MADETITNLERWVLDASQHKGELKAWAAEVRKAAAADRDLELAKEHLAKTADKTSKALQSMSAMAVAKGTLAVNLLTGAFKGLTGGVSGFIKQGMEWDRVVGKNSAALNGMAEATAGLVSKLDLARLRSRLTTGDFHATEQQMEASAKAAVLYAKAMRVDISSAIDTIATAAQRGRGQGVLRTLGLDIQLVGTASEKSAAFLKALEERFGQTTLAATTLSAKIKVAKNAMTSAFSEMSASIMGSKGLLSAMGYLTEAAQGFSLWISDKTPYDEAQGRMHDLRIEIGKLQEAMARGEKKSPDLMFGAGGIRGAGGREDIRVGASSRLASAEDELRRIGWSQSSENIRRKVAAEMDRARRSVVERSVTAAPTRARGSAKKQETTLEAMQRLTSGGEAFPSLGLGDFGISPLEARGGRFDMSGAAESIGEMNKKTQALALGEAYRKQAEEQEKLLEITKAYDATVKSFAEGSLQQLAGGLWSAIDAAVQGQSSFGAAMGAIAKAALMQVAATSAGEGMLELARGLGALAMTWGAPNPKAALHFASAAKYAAISIGTGVAGVALGAAMGGGGGSSGGAAASSGATSRAGGSTYRPAAGSRDNKDKQPFSATVNVYLDTDDPASMAHWKKRIKAELN